MNSRIFLLLISVFCISPANAVPVQGLYSAEINLPVTQSEAQMLNEAFGLAAEDVLIKVSGDKNAITGDLLEQAKKKAPTWVAQHSVASLSELLPSDDGLVPGKQVKVTFYQESIDGFLSQSNLPVWGDNRPSVLVWLVNENNGVRALSGSKEPSDALNKLAQSTSKIGVPIYAPLLDDVDKRSLSASDVWGFFEDSIMNASKRYQTDSVAALRISNYAGQVGGNLLVLLKNGETERFVLRGENLNDLIDQASAYLAKAFSSRYASVRNSGSASKINIQVVGVTNYSIMNKVQSYLESIGVVRDVTLVQVDGEKIEFSIEIDGDKQKLFNSISLSRLLINAPLNALDPDANRVVSYQYSGVN
ncbi:MAG: DUF2066 domain-containing protein [Gammaproteobacteria bacterium]|jgi:uncharacterized protein|uniref:DUF2066 domain-containing protein n=1 Tax=Marinomonas polaris DSM 16579 TaxID=1122206 RepID=A0A1M5DM76_9GAMM|nr:MULTISPECIES: DUF2066 domain-containing protein [Marinomonas]MBU1295311.1 DUF2066 domain-containing protein [Gammaproteobacteria bacterium]MBU1468850.1 DUF2066 domain-containing protein [Gammaproteobacteria bacterium]MBU2021567.1 DUF2066 domain-containing protein [Gammaproteobacteria bacterium]MBU2238020.1 DUF2066 domain-containing protein [Gammaproteobacteria bacterium]MBU2317810.1 DUF2066 domain-containing protein [Gammaproteobacteria bacterium]|tara:strand:+ start:94183 stop:95268 length:1086 start_codon:yes stop_codon:yes gene_type:complete